MTNLMTTEAAPQHIEEPATAPTVVEPYEPMYPTRLNRRESGLVRLAVILGAFLGCVGCAAHATAPQVESVGTLSAGPSVYTAPLKHDVPPSLAFVPGSDDDSASEVATTVTRVDAGEPDAAPVVEEKNAHGF